MLQFHFFFFFFFFWRGGGGAKRGGRAKPKVALSFKGGWGGGGVEVDKS